MRGPEVEKWEQRLTEVFDEIDALLEGEYGEKFPLHPARKAQGQTANPAHDGLFNIGASFSAGYGSKLGPGYVVDVRMVTLRRIPHEVREEILERVASELRLRLPKAFPERVLHVARDGHGFRIYGDLSL